MNNWKQNHSVMDKDRSVGNLNDVLNMDLRLITTKRTKINPLNK